MTRRDDKQPRQPRTGTGTGAGDPPRDADNVGDPDATFGEAIRGALRSRRIDPFAPPEDPDNGPPPAA